MNIKHIIVILIKLYEMIKNSTSGGNRTYKGGDTDVKLSHWQINVHSV